MSTNFAKEFKLYESMFSDKVHRPLREADYSYGTGPYKLDTVALLPGRYDIDAGYSDTEGKKTGKHGYEFIGSRDDIIRKLNEIAKTHEFTYIEVTQSEPFYNIIFSAHNIDNSGRRLDKVTVSINLLGIPSTEPFMSKLDIAADVIPPSTAKTSTLTHNTAKSGNSSPRNSASTKVALSNNKKYIIANKSAPTKIEKAFYNFDMNAVYFSIVKLSNASIYNSLGDARFYANQILSMSDLHRIYILDASSLQEIDSLDYYNDYEDEYDYPGYFDAP